MSDITTVKLYGNDHSPWVQAVMLGLHEKGWEYDRSTVPYWGSFKKWGPMMPAASINGSAWFLESRAILASVGFNEISDSDMLAIRRSWTGVMHRADYWPRFWGEFSLASDPHPQNLVRVAKNFLRAFTVLYFYSLIRVGVLSRGYQDPRNHADAFIYWENRLAETNTLFIEGDQPGSLDFLLFGIVQCHCSVPVPTIECLQTDSRLDRTRAWIAEMQKRFRGYSSLYSSRYFQPHGAGPTPASGVEQLAFWLGTIASVALAPITLPLVIYFIYRNRDIRGT